MIIWYVQQSIFGSGLNGQTEDPKETEDSYWTLHPTTSKHTFFSRVHGAFSTMCETAKEVLRSLKTLKWYKVSVMTTMEWNSKPVTEGKLEILQSMF